MLFPRKRPLSLLERLEQRRKRQVLLSLFVVGSILVSIFGLIYTIRLYSIYARDLLSKDRLLNRQFHGLIIYDSSNKIIYESDGAHELGTVPFSQLPLVVRNATLAAEDASFYDHPGFSWQGIARSLALNVQSSNAYAYGGSTITQQLVKNALLDDQSKSYVRKIRELLLSVGVDQRYSKDEILEMYLNSTYYGRGAYGIAQASQIYFDKPVEQLNTAEAAYLAGLPRAPSQYGGSHERATSRQQYVLSRMYEESFISSDEYTSALSSPITLVDRTIIKGVYPHFSLYVRQQILDMYGADALDTHGYKVFTTLNSSLQDVAQNTVSRHVSALATQQVSNGAAVILDSRTSAIRAMVGSADWNNDGISGKLNIALSLQQPGSSFKPIVYTRALERHIITSATPLADTPTTFGGNYSPKNYDGKFRGAVLPRRALANSLNLPAVQLINRVGVADTVSYAQSLGLTDLRDPTQYGLSLVLGSADVTPLAMTNVYATLAHGGVYNQAYAIERIVNKYGETIYSHIPEERRVADENAVFIVTSYLSDPSARQEVFGSYLQLPSRRPAAVKTGTTDDYRDAWTLGYTPSFTVGVWVGNSDNTPMDRIAGSLGAAPIWVSLIEHLTNGMPVEQFKRPAGVVEGTYCSKASHYEYDNGKQRLVSEYATARELYIKGTASVSCANLK